MKKIISLIVTAALLVSSSCLVYAGIDDLPEGFYTDFSVSDSSAATKKALAESNYKNVYELLKYLNIFNNDTMEVSAKASRGLAAHIFAGIMSGGGLAAPADKPFSDVPLTNEYVNGINTALSLGIIDSADKFTPTKAVTPKDAASMALRTLGYMGALEEKNPLPAAISMKLFKGIDSGKENLNVGDLVLLAVNTLESERAERNGFTSGGSYKIDRDKPSYLSDLGIELIEGTASAVGIFSIFEAGRPLDSRKIEINRKKYETMSPVSDTLLGKSVMGYADTENGDFMITVWADSSLNESTTLEYADVTSITQSEIKYTDDDEKIRKVSLDGGARVVYNLGYYGSMANAIADKLFDNVSEITLIDNNGDDEADIVHVKKYEYGCIDKIMTGSKIVMFKYDKESITIKENNENIVLKRGETELTLEDLQQNDVLKIMRAGSGEDERMYIDVNSKIISGKLTEVEDEGNSIAFILDGNRYELTPEYIYYYRNNTDLNNPVPEIGSTITFFIASDGKIGGSSTESAYTYAYIMGMALSESLDGKCEMKIMDINSQLHVYEVADKVKLYTPPSNSNGNYKIKGSANKEEVYKALYKDGAYTTDVIAYKLNANNKISEIVPEWVNLSLDVTETDYPLVKGFITGDANLGSQGWMGAWYYMRILSNRFSVTEGTQMIKVPLTDDNSIRLNEDYYAVYHGDNDTTFSDDNTRGKSLALYNISQEFRAQFAIYKDVAEISGEPIEAYAKTIMVAKTEYGVNSDGEGVLKVGYLNNGGVAYMELNADCEWSYEDPSSVGYYGRPDTPFDLKAGDIIQYELDGLGKVSQVRCLFRESNRGKYRTQSGTQNVGAPTTGRAFEGISISYGKVVRSDRGHVVLDQSENGDGSVTYPFFITNVRRGVHGDNTFTLYEKDTKKATEITANDIIPGDELVFRNDYNLAINAFVYR